MYKVAFVFLVAVGLCFGAPADSDEGKWQWRVVGGSNADAGAFPTIASLRSTSNSHFCGGNIITKRTIVTAGHCLVGRSPSSTIAVVGTNTLNAGGDTYQAARLLVHPDYNSWAITDDIAIAILTTDIIFSELIQPINMRKEYVGGDATVTLAGWGTTSYPGSIPNNLQYIALKTITYEDCKARHSNINTVVESEICTLTKSGEGACHGDSGGPLIFEGELVGIVSWGSPCARGYPDVFTRVSSFVDWVDANKE